MVLKWGNGDLGSKTLTLLLLLGDRIIVIQAELQPFLYYHRKILTKQLCKELE